MNILPALSQHLQQTQPQYNHHHTLTLDARPPQPPQPLTIIWQNQDQLQITTRHHPHNITTTHIDLNNPESIHQLDQTITQNSHHPPNTNNPRTKSRVHPKTPPTNQPQKSPKNTQKGPRAPSRSLDVPRVEFKGNKRKGLPCHVARLSLRVVGGVFNNVLGYCHSILRRA